MVGRVMNGMGVFMKSFLDFLRCLRREGRPSMRGVDVRLTLGCEWRSGVGLLGLLCLAVALSCPYDTRA